MKRGEDDVFVLFGLDSTLGKSTGLSFALFSIDFFDSLDLSN
jgi:hypothetical protein